MSASSDPRRFAQWLSVGQLISWGSVFYMFAVLLEPVERDLGLTRAQSSLAFSLALLAEGLMAYPVGRWIDRGHERAVMTGGSMLIVIGLLLLSQAQGLWSFYAAWMLIGVALAGTLYTPAFAIVTRRFPHDFRRAIITMTFLGGLASTVFIPLIAWLEHREGWRHTLWMIAALHAVVCVPLHALLLRDAPRAAQTMAASTPEPAAEPAARCAPDDTLRAHLRSAPFLLLSVFVVIMMAITAALPAHLVSLLRESGLPEAWVVAIPASIGVIQVLGRALLYFFEHRFDVHVANRVIPVLIPLALAALLLGAGHGMAGLLFVLLYGLGNGMLTIVKGTAIAQYVSRDHVATLNGALGLPLAAARALAPLALGLMWTPAVGYRWGLVLLLVLSVAAVLALLETQRRALGRSR